MHSHTKNQSSPASERTRLTRLVALRCAALVAFNSTSACANASSLDRYTQASRSAWSYGSAATPPPPLLLALPPPGVALLFAGEGATAAAVWCEIGVEGMFQGLMEGGA